MSEKKNRIWEIDALRGFFMLFVFASHFTFDLSAVFGTAMPENPVIFFLFQYGGALFIVISGISATLGSKSFKRGLFVFGCGMLITLITVVLFKLDIIGEGDLIQFGVLHLIGTCMMLYPLLKKLPNSLLIAVSAVLFAVGVWLEGVNIPYNTAVAFDIRNYLFMFGLHTENFAAADYFPILPNLSYFMLGIVLGRLAYPDKKSLFPNFPKDFCLIRALRFIGRHSLIFYLAHQPIFLIVMEIIAYINE